MIDGGTSGTTGGVVDVEVADSETASLMITVFTSHWMVNHTGLDLVFGQQYVWAPFLHASPITTVVAIESLLGAFAALQSS